MTPRERLAAVAAEHGHDPATLALVCEAILPAHAPGDRVTDDQLAVIADGVDVLATAGLHPGRLARVIALHKARRGPAWRESFWGAWCRAADRRAHHAEAQAAASAAAATQQAASEGAPPASRAD